MGNLKCIVKNQTTTPLKVSLDYPPGNSGFLKRELAPGQSSTDEFRKGPQVLYVTIENSYGRNQKEGIIRSERQGQQMTIEIYDVAGEFILVYDEKSKQKLQKAISQQNADPQNSIQSQSKVAIDNQPKIVQLAPPKDQPKSNSNLTSHNKEYQKDEGFLAKYELTTSLISQYPKYSFEGIIEYVLDCDDVSKTDAERIERLENWGKPENGGPNDSFGARNVWLIIGETGQGKSAFVNHVYGDEISKGIHQETSEVSIYRTKDVVLVDTPGLFDIRIDMKNNKIMNLIIASVKEQLKESARIDAILLMWNPVKVERFRLEEILAEITSLLGESALNSIVLIINKISPRWHQEHSDNVEQLRKSLEQKKLYFPIVIYDCKTTPRNELSIIEEATLQVDAFKEDEFMLHRMNMYYEKYLKLQKARDEKKKEIDEKLQALQKNFDKQTLEQKKEFERLKTEQDKLMKENIKDYQARCNQIKENATNAIASQQQKIKELENKLNQNHQQLLQAQQRAQQPIYVEKVTSYYSSYQPQQPLVYDRNKYYGGIPLKLDGTPDMRYKVNKQLFGRRG